jgi:hypothetical protein
MLGLLLFISPERLTAVNYKPINVIKMPLGIMLLLCPSVCLLEFFVIINDIVQGFDQIFAPGKKLGCVCIWVTLTSFKGQQVQLDQNLVNTIERELRLTF